MKPADPDRVIAAARAWLGTPYHDQASLRGVGCDCLGLARGVWREVVGPEPFPIPAYSRDWGETEAVAADAAQARLVVIRRSEPGARHGDDPVWVGRRHSTPPSWPPSFVA